MKKALRFLIIVFTLLNCTQSLIVSQGLYDVSASLQFVYAAGTNGTIMKSSNSGINYAIVHSGGSRLYSVFSMGGYVWAAGEGGAFLSSSDRGITWNSFTITNGDAVRSIYFTDSLTGFAAGANGLILKSVNGGNNWISLSSGTGITLTKIKFINSSTGYVCGSNFFGRTTDGGMTWNSAALPVTSNSISMDALGSTVLLGLDDSRIMISDNMGANWDVINLKIYTRPAVASVYLKNETTFSALLETGSVWNSSNRGVSFTWGVSPMLSAGTALTFSSFRGFIVSDRHNMILRSVDNGVNWQFPNSVTTTIIFQIILPNAGSSLNKILDINYQKRGVLYACRGNELLRSVNFGTNWAPISTIPLGGTCQQLLVSMKDSAKMISVINQGSIGNVFRTTNSGSNWSLTYQAPVDVIGNLLAQTPSSPDTVYLGVRDSIMRSTDFGLSWIKIAGYEFDDWCDIAVNPADPNMIYAATNHFPAKLHKSTNGGYNWYMTDYVFDTTYSEMPCIAVSSLRPNLVFHAQYSGQQTQKGLKRSFSQGNSWLFTAFDGISWAVDIAKDDPNLVAYGSVSYTPVYISSNSGTNYLATPSQYAEQLFYYDRSNLYATNGSTIYRMRVVYEMSPIGITQLSGGVPKSFMLAQNYPNPFNPVTNIKFDVPGNTNVKISVFDVTGRVVTELVDQQMNAGRYQTEWNASGISSGIYFYRMEASEFTETKKLILLK